MNESQFKQALSVLNKAHQTAIAEHQKNVNELRLQFISDNAKFKIGDITSDLNGNVIEIERIQASPFHLGTDDVPIPYYQGYVLTKRLERRKDQSRLLRTQHELTLYS
ncbi:hypothetical protein [Photobacterium leiognathi]|uniref:hypothetical protein n=1 Tax=Photobacterium leiognathi TaxID=553611 RepID=UPI002981BDDA|nr:hypothetical protein [Photobacterium leiognathi]